MTKHLDYTKNRVKLKYISQLSLGIDEAWFAVAKRNCSVAYGFIYNIFTDKLLACEVMSRLKRDCELNSVKGITRKTTGKQLGWISRRTRKLVFGVCLKVSPC